MTRSTVKQKRKHSGGRPRTGITPLVAFRPPADLIRAVDDWAASAGVTRSEALRRLIELGLKAKGGKLARAKS